MATGRERQKQAIHNSLNILLRKRLPFCDFIMNQGDFHHELVGKGAIGIDGLKLLQPTAYIAADVLGDPTRIRHGTAIVAPNISKRKEIGHNPQGLQVLSVLLYAKVSLGNFGNSSLIKARKP